MDKKNPFFYFKYKENIFFYVNKKIRKVFQVKAGAQLRLCESRTRLYLHNHRILNLQEFL